jgi:membrane protein implicated in regulation of membrane protease activity
MFEWWQWVVMGLFLAMAELAIPSFFIIWFGIGAVCVGLLLLLMPDLTLSTQVLVWTMASSILVVLWFRYLRPRTRTAVGTSAANVAGEVGILVNELPPQARGLVRFQKPILGADTWECYAEQHLKAGDRVRVVAVWFRYLRPGTRTLVGTSAASVAGEIGILVNDLPPQARGHVRFQKPILGSDIWECYAEQHLKAGERVRAVVVEGNFIKVEASK